MTRLLNARYPLLAAFVLFACQPAFGVTAPAADDDEEEQEPWNARWSLEGAVEVDQQSNRGLDVAVGYAVTPTTSVRFAGNSTAFSPTLSNGFHSNGVEIGAAHDFKHFSLNGAIARWQDSDILTATEAKLGLDVRSKRWGMGVTGMYRRSSFEPLTITTPLTLEDGTSLPEPAVSTCKLNNTGFGAHGDYAGQIWSARARFQSYQYKSADCTFSNLTGLDVRTHLVKDVFAQVEATLVDQLETIGVRRIGRENTLLSNEFGGGASWRHQDFIVSLDYTRQAEYFSGNSSDTLTATGTADMGHNSGVDLVLGYTRGNTVSEGAFVGFVVRAHF